MIPLGVIQQQASAPAGLTAYPLDDNGSLAGAFGYARMATNAPGYVHADYTYAAPATGGTAVALPAGANWLTTQAIPLTAGKIIELQARIDSVSALNFGNIGLAIGFSLDQVPSLTPFIVGINRDATEGARIFSSGDGFAARSGAANGFVVGMSLNTTTGAIKVRTSDGTFTSLTTFTPGVGAITAYLFANDSGVPAAGQTASVTLFEHGEDYPLATEAGAVDILGQVIV